MATDILIDLGHFHPVDAEILLKIEFHFELPIRNGKGNVNSATCETYKLQWVVIDLILTFNYLCSDLIFIYKTLLLPEICFKINILSNYALY